MNKTKRKLQIKKTTPTYDFHPRRRTEAVPKEAWRAINRERKNGKGSTSSTFSSLYLAHRNQKEIKKKSQNQINPEVMLYESSIFREFGSHVVCVENISSLWDETFFEDIFSKEEIYVMEVKIKEAETIILSAPESPDASVNFNEAKISSSNCKEFGSEEKKKIKKKKKKAVEVKEETQTFVPRHALVQVKSLEDGNKAIQIFSSPNFANSGIQINWAKHSSKGKNSVISNSIHVHYNALVPNVRVTEETLREVFSAFGQVVDVWIKTPKSNLTPGVRSTGYGFVDFEQGESGIRSVFIAIAQLTKQKEVNGVEYTAEPSKNLLKMFQDESNSERINRIRESAFSFVSSSGGLSDSKLLEMKSSNSDTNRVDLGKLVEGKLYGMSEADELVVPPGYLSLDNLRDSSFQLSQSSSPTSSSSSSSNFSSFASESKQVNQSRVPQEVNFQKKLNAATGSVNQMSSRSQNMFSQQTAHNDTRLVLQLACHREKHSTITGCSFALLSEERVIRPRGFFNSASSFGNSDDGNVNVRVLHEESFSVSVGNGLDAQLLCLRNSLLMTRQFFSSHELPPLLLVSRSESLLTRLTHLLNILTSLSVVHPSDDCYGLLSLLRSFPRLQLQLVSYHSLKTVHDMAARSFNHAFYSMMQQQQQQQQQQVFHHHHHHHQQQQQQQHHHRVQKQQDYHNNSKNYRSQNQVNNNMMKTRQFQESYAQSQREDYFPFNPSRETSPTPSFSNSFDSLNSASQRSSPLYTSSSSSSRNSQFSHFEDDDEDVSAIVSELLHKDMFLHSQSPRLPPHSFRNFE